MHLDSLYRQLKSGIPPLILLYGQESMLIEQATRHIRKAIFNDATDDFNDHRLFGKGLSAQEIIDVARTLPVFAPRRLVTVRNFHEMAPQEQELLIGYLDDPAPETCLLLMADKIDSRKKFFLQFKKSGLVFKCDPLTDKDIPDYIVSLLQRQGITITGQALDFLSSMIGTGLHELEGEVGKLLLYLGERRRVDIADIEAIISRGRMESVFELSTAIGRGQLERALTLVRRFAAASEPPLLMLNLITAHYRLLWKVKSLRQCNVSPADIARQVGRPPFVVQKILEQGRQFAQDDLMPVFQLLIEADLAMKSSGADGVTVLEQLVLRLIRDKQKPEEQPRR